MRMFAAALRRVLLTVAEIKPLFNLVARAWQVASHYLHGNWWADDINPSPLAPPTNTTQMPGGEHMIKLCGASVLGALVKSP